MMWDFLLRKIVVGGAQRYLDRLKPDVSVYVPPDLPLPSAGALKRMGAVVSKINGLGPQMKELSDEALHAKTEEFRNRYNEAVKEARAAWEEGLERFHAASAQEDREALSIEEEQLHDHFKKARRAALDDLLPEAFAAVREASRRTMGMTHYDIQLIGGMILHQGKIAEMATGEGKTLMSTLPAYLNALTGEGVHVVTVNDYLAGRDRDWMSPIFTALGITVGTIVHDMDFDERQAAYACDITYGTNNEFGFDYLRDNMVGYREEMVQRQHHFAIVDEVDSILIDEARTPLIISGPAEESTDKYYRAFEIAGRLHGRRITEQQEIDAKYRNEDLSEGYDYVADEKLKSVALTEPGELKVAEMFGIPNLHDMDTIEYRHHILQALKAHEFFKRDVDYVVRDGEVIIVDEFTGRMMPGRRWSDGLHQAVEAKEGIKIARENQTLATITFQNYFRMYDKLSGMTGTAHTEASEFKEIYKLDVVVLPTNRVLLRKNYTDVIYKTVREKFNAVADELAEFYQRGQPVLVGTISIEKSELLSSMLKQRGIPHEVLNAKYHEREAQIVAQAGRYKAITIATNMAGRGTDIVLGGNAEFLARSLADEKSGPDEDPDKKEEMVKKFIEQFRAQVKKEHEQVVAAGGLHVLGTERHESRRIDNQLRGRSGRQGDPGSSKFFVSLEDDLMRLFASDKISSMMDRLGMEEGQVIEHPWVSRAIEVAQKRVESHNFEIRKQLLEFDNVMNKQREAIYGLRSNILESRNIRDRIVEAIEEVSDMTVDKFLTQGQEGEGWDLEGLEVYLKVQYGLDISSQREEIRDMQPEQLQAEVREKVLGVYEAKEREISPERMRLLERAVLLNTIDAKWKDHLYAMDQLKGGVALRAYGQRDPVIEFKREGYEMFQMMYTSINEEVADIIFKVQPVEEGDVYRRNVFADVPQQLVHTDFTSMSGQQEMPPGQAAPGMPDAQEPPPPQTVRHSGPKVGRNDPCPCGSGKKYKKCCGR